MTLKSLYLRSECLQLAQSLSSHDLHEVTRVVLQLGICQQGVAHVLGCELAHLALCIPCHHSQHLCARIVACNEAKQMVSSQLYWDESTQRLHSLDMIKCISCMCGRQVQCC
jgi:hypothetical protein